MTTQQGTTRRLVLRTFRDFTDCHSGIPPTVREICALVGLKSTSGALGHVTQLIDRGLIADQFPEFVMRTYGASGPARRYAITSLGRQAIEEDSQ